MALRLERADLVAALTATARVVETRNTYPILANVLLSVADGRLTVRSTDLDIEITTSVPAEGDLPTTTAPAKTLLDIAKKFPAGAEVTLDLEGEALTVKAGRSRFKLACLDADAFPTISTGTFGSEFEVDLASLFAPVAFAISSEETRHYLCGIYLLGVDGDLTAVATDGHRLAKHVLPSGDFPEFAGIIIPAKTVGVVPQGPVQVAVSDTKVRLRKGDTTIVSKLIEGTYPQYERVIPKNNEFVVTADRAALLEAVSRVGTVATDRSRAVKFDVSGEAITLTLQSDTDSAADEVAAQYNGEPVETGLNTRYLQDILGAISGPTVSMALSRELGPILLRGDNDNWTGVQMPVRVA